MSFLVLSTEIIDDIFKNLFPKGMLKPHSEARDARSVPTDLLHCRFVCRRFKGIATRWIWRRLVLKSASVHLQDVCKFLRHHPDIATNVRRLSLHTNKYDDDVDDLFNFIDIMPLLTCLRHLTLSGKLPRTLGQQSLGSFSLSSITGLHTLILSDLDCSRIGLKETTKLTSIKHLRLSNCRSTHVLWASLPSVEVCCCCRQTVFLLPWQSLREVAILGGEKAFDEVTLEFQRWRQDSADKSGSPLIELALSADLGVDIDIEEIAKVFGGQPLKKLLVSFVDEMTILRLQQLVEAFPELEDLLVLASDPDADPSWEGSIVEFAQMLGLLKNLRVLSWNYTRDLFGGEQGAISDTESESSDDLHYVDGLPIKYWEGSEYDPQSPPRSPPPAEQQPDAASDEGKAVSTPGASSVRSRSMSTEPTESISHPAPDANAVASQTPFELNWIWFTRCRGFASCLGEHCLQLQRINFHNMSGIGGYQTGVIRFERESGLDVAGKGKMRFRGTFDLEDNSSSWATKSDI